MDVREKLVEILKQAPFEGKVLDEWLWEEKIRRIADHLISNGVTVQEWISVKDRLPDNKEHDWVLAQVVEDNGYMHIPRVMEYRQAKNDWFEETYGWLSEHNGLFSVTHWMPLPHPPKCLQTEKRRNMKIINASYSIETPIDGAEILKRIEKAGRTCYKSEDRITDESAKAFVRKLIERWHESVLEHESITVRFVCDRGISHEIVRHRIASFSQESQRYVRYNGDIEFINPHMPNVKAYEAWQELCERAEETYRELLSYGVQPEQARAVLPNSTKTEVVMTANLREWRHFLKLRTAKAAHPQMRELTVPLLHELQERIPVVFDDIQP